jgi:hypothetical protein
VRAAERIRRWSEALREGGRRQDGAVVASALATAGEQREAVLESLRELLPGLPAVHDPSAAASILSPEAAAAKPAATKSAAAKTIGRPAATKLSSTASAAAKDPGLGTAGGTSSGARATRQVAAPAGGGAGLKVLPVCSSRLPLRRAAAFSSRRKGCGRV